MPATGMRNRRACRPRHSRAMRRARVQPTCADFAARHRLEAHRLFAHISINTDPSPTTPMVSSAMNASEKLPALQSVIIRNYPVESILPLNRVKFGMAASVANEKKDRPAVGG